MWEVGGGSSWYNDEYSYTNYIQFYSPNIDRLIVSYYCTTDQNLNSEEENTSYRANPTFPNYTVRKVSCLACWGFIG